MGQNEEYPRSTRNTWRSTEACFGKKVEVGMGGNRALDVRDRARSKLRSRMLEENEEDDDDDKHNQIIEDCSHELEHKCIDNNMYLPMEVVSKMRHDRKHVP